MRWEVRGQERREGWERYERNERGMRWVRDEGDERSERDGWGERDVTKFFGCSKTAFLQFHKNALLNIVNFARGFWIL